MEDAELDDLDLMQSDELEIMLYLALLYRVFACIYEVTLCGNAADNIANALTQTFHHILNYGQSFFVLFMDCCSTFGGCKVVRIYGCKEPLKKGC